MSKKIKGAISFVLVVAMLFVSIPAAAGIYAAHTTQAAHAARPSIPSIEAINNRRQMLVILLEYENGFYPHNGRFSSTLYGDIGAMAFWSNRFFGATNSVNAFFAETSHNFNLQFAPPTFTEDCGFYIVDPTPDVSLVKIENGVMVVRLREYGRTSNPIPIEYKTRIYNAISPFIDLSQIPRYIDANGNQRILTEYFMTYIIQAGSRRSGGHDVGAHANNADGAFVCSNGFLRTNAFVHCRDGHFFDMGYATQAEHGHLHTAPSSFLTIIHEIGHLLNLPHLYGMDRYTPMGAGGNLVHFSPWEKMMLGFVRPIVVDVYYGMQAVYKYVYSINPHIDVPCPYNIIKIRNPAVNPNQYFLIENRQNLGFDANLAAGAGAFAPMRSGLLIWHVDEDVIFAQSSRYTPTRSLGNQNNNGKHGGVRQVNISYLWPTTPHSDSPANNNSFFANYCDTRRNVLNHQTEPNSNFHMPRCRAYRSRADWGNPIDCCPRIIPSGIDIAVLCESGVRMQIRISYNSFDFDLPCAGLFGGGYGRFPSPFIIATPAHLIEMQNKVNGNAEGGRFRYAHFRLGADIVLSGQYAENFVGIGAVPAAALSFRGIFCGNNHKIDLGDALTNGIGATGLFRFVSARAEIENLRISGEVSTNGNAGLLIGSISGGTITNIRIRNVYIYQPNIISTNPMAGVGAMVGMVSDPATDLRIYNSFVNGGVVRSSGYAGGMVGGGDGRVYIHNSAVANIEIIQTTTTAAARQIGGFRPVSGFTRIENSAVINPAFAISGSNVRIYGLGATQGRNSYLLNPAFSGAHPPVEFIPAPDNFIGFFTNNGGIGIDDFFRDNALGDNSPLAGLGAGFVQTPNTALWQHLPLPTNIAYRQMVDYATRRANSRPVISITPGNAGIEPLYGATAILEIAISNMPHPFGRIDINTREPNSTAPVIIDIGIPRGGIMAFGYIDCHGDGTGGGPLTLKVYDPAALPYLRLIKTQLLR